MSKNNAKQKRFRPKIEAKKKEREERISNLQKELKETGQSHELCTVHPTTQGPLNITGPS